MTGGAFAPRSPNSKGECDMDGLNKSNCGFAEICKLSSDSCLNCKVDKETSDFHKEHILGMTWDKLFSIQRPCD